MCRSATNEWSETFEGTPHPVTPPQTPARYAPCRTAIEMCGTPCHRHYLVDRWCLTSLLRFRYVRSEHSSAASRPGTTRWIPGTRWIPVSLTTAIHRVVRDLQ